jgi:predicted nucleotidyltransferase
MGGIADPMPVARDLHKVAQNLDTRLMLVGAYARDLCLGNAEPTRGTTDADFALQVDDWAGVDAFVEACRDSFERFDLKELKMFHIETGLKVDLVPCGAIEEPAGILRLRGGSRALNTVGLVECFELGSPIHSGIPRVLVPSAAGFLLLKLLAYRDCAAPRDLRDFGFVLHQFPVDNEAVFNDDELMKRFEDGTLVFDVNDLSAWQAGSQIATVFSPDAVVAFGEALKHLADREPRTRTYIVEDSAVSPDERLDTADRIIRTLRDAISAR